MCANAVAADSAAAAGAGAGGGDGGAADVQAAGGGVRWCCHAETQLKLAIDQSSHTARG